MINICQCVTLNLNKYYKDGVSYFPSSDAVIYYDKCSSKGACSIYINHLGTLLSIPILEELSFKEWECNYR